MSEQLKEFLVKHSILYGFDAQDQKRLYFLLFNINSEYSKKLVSFLRTPDQQMEVKYDEIESYFTIMNVVKHIGPVVSENQKLIKKICRDYLGDKVILTLTDNELLFCEINVVDEREGDSVILGVLLKDSNELAEIVSDSNVLVISSFAQEASDESGKINFR
jgi:hypothetical protein